MPVKRLRPRSDAPYIGRFAPSPSGRLHFGSLVCALASYLDARANEGQWLVRMEDIDPPREEAGASDAILQCLKAHGLTWDGEVLYQSSRGDAYNDTLAWLAERHLTYRCDCTRKRLRALNGNYDGYCRERTLAPDAHAALRLRTSALPAGFAEREGPVAFADSVCGPQHTDLAQAGGDFVVHRKDGLFAYQLAVTVDDIAQGITHVVRGNDLLETTPQQCYLMRLLGATAPLYAHIPVVVDERGDKLSKQTFAPPVDPATPAANLRDACRALGLTPPADADEVAALLDWAVNAWDLERLPAGATVPDRVADTPGA